MRFLGYPRGLFLYVLIYWGRTLLGLLIAAYFVVWFVDSDAVRLGYALSGAAVGVAMFNLGLAVGELGSLPPGKRR